MQQKCLKCRTTNIQVLIHHIYEYKKGLRNLVLHTMTSHDQNKAENLLTKKNINYIIQHINKQKINIFFGKTQCLQIIENFGNKPLCNFSDEEDFILGIMLGYDRTKQCDRYLKRKKMKSSKNENKIVNF